MRGDQVKHIHFFREKIKSKQKIAAFVDIHSYSQFIMSPYGIENKYPPHHEELVRVSRIAASALKEVHGTQYKYGQIFETIRYSAAGDAISWAMEKVRPVNVYI